MYPLEDVVGSLLVLTFWFAPAAVAAAGLVSLAWRRAARTGATPVETA